MKKYFIFSIALISTLFASTANAQYITTVAGDGTSAYTGDGGTAVAAEMQNPGRICTDTAGNVYFLDLLNNAARKISAAGDISTIAGAATGGFSGDGGPATDALLYHPLGIASDITGNIYIADAYNWRIRKIDATSGNISTIAGSNTFGFSGDGGPATNAKLYAPDGLAIDDSGNVYIADWYNDRIRKVSAANGLITTIAGTGTAGSAGDGGPATAAQIDSPISVGVDHAYNVYIGDYSNKIRKIDAVTKVISTFAGTGTYGYAGDNGPATAAQFKSPYDIQADNMNNLYIADEGNSVIRKIDLSTNIITTIAGTAASGYNGDGIPATSAELNFPIGVCADRSGNTVYIADRLNSRIRKVSYATAAVADIAQKTINIVPNPSRGVFMLQRTNNTAAVLQVYDMLGRVVYQCPLNTMQQTIDLSANSPGIYYLYVVSQNGVQTGKVELTQ